MAVNTMFLLEVDCKTVVCEVCPSATLTTFSQTPPPPPAGKKNKLRVYYLSWLRNKILHNDPEVEKKQGWVNVGDLEGCVHYKVGTLRCLSEIPQMRGLKTSRFKIS